MDYKELNFEKMQAIGAGSEGIVYKNQNEAIKLFHGSYDIKDKYKKIIILESLNIDFLVKPKKFITKENKTIGYSMELIENAKELNGVFKFKTLDEKIKSLKTLENNIKELHKKHIVLVDCNLHNFLVKDNKIKHIDIDNYQVGDLPANVFPDYYHPYYSEKVTKNIDPNIDKFQMTLNAIETLADAKFFKHFIRHYDKNRDYLEFFINSLKIDNKLKEFLLQQTSDSINKEYISDYLHLFKK